MLCVSLLVAACGGSDETAIAPAATAAPTADLLVSVERSRLFEQQRTMAVTAENRGADTVALVDPWLDSGRHEVAQADPRTVTLEPGRRLTFPLPYGPARCDGDLPDVLTVHALIAGVDVSFESPITDPIRGTHERECAAERARAGVELAFADDWAVDGATAAGTLTVRPTEPDVAVTDVRTAIVFVTQVGAPLPATTDLPLTVSAQRCDVHALIESKKTFTVAVHVQVGDADPVPVEIVADDGAVRSALDRAIEACVTAEGAG